MEYSLGDIEARLTPSERMPVLFVGHGNPMNAISDNDYTREWARVGRELPEPQAIVVISAHWLTPGSTHITDAPRNRVIYDFGGFPDELYHVQYPTRGDAEVARYPRAPARRVRGPARCPVGARPRHLVRAQAPGARAGDAGAAGQHRLRDAPA